jgi:hypothetical protein
MHELVTHLEKVWEDEAPHLLEVGRAPDLGALQQKGQRLGSSRPVRTQCMSTPNSIAGQDPESGAFFTPHPGYSRYSIIPSTNGPHGETIMNILCTVYT